MWDTLTITYEGSSQIKRNKLSLLTRKFELFTIGKGEDIPCIFSRFQTILNELRSLGRTLDNYDHIDKDYVDLEKNKHNLWVDSEEHKRSMKVLNEQHLKNEEFKGQHWPNLLVEQKVMTNCYEMVVVS